VNYKSSVPIPLEEHLLIYLFSPLNSVLPAARVPLHSHAVDRAQLLSAAQFLQADRACTLHSRAVARAQPLSNFPF